MKQPRTAYTFFYQDRFASGDFTGISIAESGTLVGKEWHELSDSAKKVWTNNNIYIFSVWKTLTLLFSLISPRPMQIKLDI